MLRKFIPLLHFLLSSVGVYGQDTSILYEGKVIQLSEVVVRSDVNVNALMQRVKDDTGFYKAFRNLRILQYSTINDIRMLNSKGQLAAFLRSKTRQHAFAGCRYTEVLEETHGGDFYDKQGDFRYYTAAIYAGLMFAPDTICGETNIVKHNRFDPRQKKGMEKHREQLKMLFFNPGVAVPGVPFIGNKLGIFDEDMKALYQFHIDLVSYRGENCYLFEVKAKPDISPLQRRRIVIDEMKTWFAVSDLSIMGKTYRMQYNAGVYDFDVIMEVALQRFGNLNVPVEIKYNGNWDVPFRKRERGVFTATLYDFSN